MLWKVRASATMTVLKNTLELSFVEYFKLYSCYHNSDKRFVLLVRENTSAQKQVTESIRILTCIGILKQLQKLFTASMSSVHFGSHTVGASKA